ncbi:MAG TPA: hypothetical protein VMF59_09755 [Bacteroidota bacterium]|nr:hypothetical protein [Bacteroidota bacterium]
MTSGRHPGPALAWVAVFSLAFAFVEASVVIYLRALYYPDGFSFPLKLMQAGFLRVEIAREAATIIMLASVGIIAGFRPWERFGYFLFAFGVWDIAFYAWLLAAVGWPGSLFDWDILFLIPLPWIGPVIAPMAISLLMVAFGAVMVLRSAAEKRFRPGALSWALGLAGTASVLYSFMADTDAGIRGAYPIPYHYGLLAAGLAAYIAGFVTACRAARSMTGTPAGD